MTVINTDRINIVDFEKKHITDKYISWLNNRELMKYSEQRHRVHSIENCENYLNGFTSTPNYFFALEDKINKNGIVGTMTVYVDKFNNIADVGILIGDPVVQGKKYGFEAWSAVLNWLMNDLDVRKITAGTLSINKPMLAIMKKSGMEVDGIRQKHYLVNSSETDIIYMAKFNKYFST